MKWKFDFNEFGWFYMNLYDNGATLGPVEWAEIPPDDWPQPVWYAPKLNPRYKQAEAIGHLILFATTKKWSVEGALAP